MSEIKVQSRKKTELIDITSAVNKVLKEDNIKDGFILIFTKHTTSGLTINENESGLVGDMVNFIEQVVPEGPYKHDRIDNNASSHLRSMLIEHSLLLPVMNEQLNLGTWQKLFFVELDGPRSRTIDVRLLLKR